LPRLASRRSRIAPPPWGCLHMEHRRWTWRLLSHEWVHCHWVFVQILPSRGVEVCPYYLTRPTKVETARIMTQKCSERIPWNAWKPQLYALVMEELPLCLSRFVQRILQCGDWSRGGLWPLVLAFFFLASWDHTMTSTCCSALRFFRN
jgi:hypothetical protein